MQTQTTELPTTSPRPSDGAGSWRLWTFAWRLGAALPILYLLIVLAAMFLENSFIFIPSRYPIGEWQPRGLDFDDVAFESADGTRLHGWYVPCPNAKATILFCHGNAGNLTHRAEIVRALRDRAGASVLLFDYRGYGRSEGKPDEAGILADARAARAWLAAREKIPEKDIVVMGESIGGAVAVDLAARDGARALVLESTFANLPDMAAYHFPWLPLRMMLRTRLDSAAKIVNYRGPLLQAHGDADQIVPLKFGRQLFDVANQPKQFILLPGHDHNEPMPASYYDRLRKFFEGLGK